MRRLFKFLSVVIVSVFVLQVFAPGITGIAALTFVDGNVPKSASKGTIISGDGTVTLSKDLASAKRQVTDRDVTSGEETAILGEVEELRSEYAKHYRHVDGTYTATLYSEPVHYKDKNGDWQDIDNTLKLNSDKKSASGKATYTVASSDVDVRVPQDFGNNQKLTIEKDGFAIGMGIRTAQTGNFISAESIDNERLSGIKAEINNNYIAHEKDTLSSDANTEKLTVSEKNKQKMKLDKRVSGVSYNDVFPDTDLEYVITSSKIKESIVVNEKQDEYTYQFTMDLGDLVPVPQENGSIHLKKSVKDKESVFVIEAPYMFDANEEASYDVVMTLENNILTVTADEEWINAEEREFPITIDPTVTVEETSIKDTYVGYYFENSNFSDENYLGVGDGIATLRRSYIKFELPAVPEGSIITNASLHLVQKDLDYDKTDRQFCVIDLTGKPAWNADTITWNNQPINKDKIEFNESGEIKKLDFQEVVPGYDRAYTFDITKAVKYWYEGDNNGNSTNNGIMLANNDETKNSYARFYSVDNASEAYRPAVTIKYNLNLGLEDYWSYETLDLERSGALYVNDYNGGLTYVHNDVSMTGNLLPINISHVYNSFDEGLYSTYYSEMDVGDKFHLNLQELLIPIVSGDSMYADGYRYKYYDGDGTIHYFCENSESICYEFDPNVVITQSGTDTIITDANSNKRYFSNNRLYKLEDKDGNAQTITFDGNKITRVTDPVGRYAEFEYDTNNRLDKITYPVNRTVDYDYTEAGQLTLIAYSDNKETEIEYAADSSITFFAVNGLSAKAEFIETVACGNRVSKLSQYDKNNAQMDCLTFEYTQNDESGYAMGNTKVSNSYGDYNTYLFDAYGRATSIINQDGQCVFSVYESEASTSQYLFNKVTDSSDLLTIANNLVYNHGFERDDYWAALQGSVSDACTYSLTESMHGDRSLKLQLANDAQTAEMGQDFTAVAGENYTISAYINIPEALELTGSNGVAFGFMYEADGEWVSESSDWIGSTSGWERFSHIIKIPEGVTVGECRVFLKLAKVVGTVYFDSVQVEKSGGARMYNLIENSDFSNAPVNPDTNLADGTQPDVWTVTNGGEYDGVYYYNKISANEMRMTGHLSKQKSVSQLVPVSASSGDILIIGGKAAAYATYDEANERKFGIIATLYKEMPTEETDEDNIIDAAEIEFDRTINMEHQTRARRIELTEDCGYILFEFVFYNQIDCVAFNNGFIYVGSFGEHYEYDENTGNLTSENNDEGTTTSYEYDDNKLEKVSQTVSGVETVVAEYEYDNNGEVSKIINNEGTEISYEECYEDGNLVSEVYQTESEGENEKLIEKVTYLQNGNYVKSIEDSNGSVTEYTYNDLGLVISENTDGNVVTYTYDADTDELISTTGNVDDSTSRTVSFTYEDGNLKKILKGSSQYTHSYDSQNRVRTMMVGARVLWRKNFDSEQRLESLVYTGGNTYSPIYDARDRVVGDKWNSTQTAAYYYNENDVLCKYDDLTTGVSYQYDYAFYGLLHRIDSSNGYRTEYDYDMSGKLSHLTFSNNGDKIYSARYVSNEKGYPEDVTIETMDSALLHYNYNSSGNLESKSSGPVISTVTYLEKNGLTTDLIQQYTNEDFDGNILQNYVYTYDAKGNIASITETVSNSITTYAYDGLNRLVRETIDNDVYEYAYNEYGHMTSVTKNGELVHNFTFGVSAWKDLLATVDGDSLTYNMVGTPKTYNGYTFTWQRNNQLTGISGDETNITYTYDAQGKRIRQVVNGLTLDYVYSGDILMRQTDGTNVLDFAYDASGTIIGFKYNGTPYFYVKNPQGDVVAILDAEGNNVANYSYDSYGNLLSYSGTMASINPIRYRSYYQDPETGWYYLKTRYYNPEWRRFISPDSVFVAGDDIINGTNMFTYCNDNPVKYVDSEGTDAKENLIGNLIRAGSKAVSLTIIPETVVFFAVANIVVLPAVKGYFGDDFANSEFMQETGIEFLSEAATNLLPIFSGDKTDEVPSGLRHVMPANMALGAPWAGYFLGFETSTFGKGFLKHQNYTTVEGKYMWQSEVGYSWLYDYFFSLGGPIERYMYKFKSNDINYVIWCWKGDYWNLGAGAEIGIYKTDNDNYAENNFYLIDESLTVHTRMIVKYRWLFGSETAARTLIDFHQTNWWITVFTPIIQQPRVDYIDVEFYVRFTEENQYSLMKSFLNTYEVKKKQKDWNEVSTLPWVNKTKPSGHKTHDVCGLNPAKCTCTCPSGNISCAGPCTYYTYKCTSADAASGCQHYNDSDNGFQFKIKF